MALHGMQHAMSNIHFTASVAVPYLPLLPKRPMAELLVEKITKEFSTPREPLVILREISFELETGKNLAILGPSGSGKSTLLHILGGLDQPTAGTVTLHGQQPWKMSAAELARFRNAEIGFIFQDHHLLPQLNLLENTLIPALAAGSPSEAVVARAKQLLERVGLAERLTHRPAELSGGERQRAGVARALVLKPKLLLADEPTGNLDRAAAANVSQLLLELQREEGTMLVVVTHSRELAELMDRRCEINAGRLVELA